MKRLTALKEASGGDGSIVGSVRAEAVQLVPRTRCPLAGKAGPGSTDEAVQNVGAGETGGIAETAATRRQQKSGIVRRIP